jgi:OFA family oxalate/formate antiporter-like MFS transporter
VSRQAGRAPCSDLGARRRASPFGWIRRRFAILGALILFCYGGSSGTMAATTADLFGSRHVGAIYGLMLTAWGFGGVLGPLIVAVLRESSGGYSSALRIIAAIMLASAALPLLIRAPRRP